MSSVGADRLGPAWPAGHRLDSSPTKPADLYPASSQLLQVPTGRRSGSALWQMFSPMRTARHVSLTFGLSEVHNPAGTLSSQEFMHVLPVCNPPQTVKCSFNTCRARSSAPLLLYTSARLCAASRRTSSSGLTGTSLRHRANAVIPHHQDHAARRHELFPFACCNMIPVKRPS